MQTYLNKVVLFIWGTYAVVGFLYDIMALVLDFWDNIHTVFHNEYTNLLS